MKFKYSLSSTSIDSYLNKKKFSYAKKSREKFNEKMKYYLDYFSKKYPHKKITYSEVFNKLYKDNKINTMDEDIILYAINDDNLDILTTNLHRVCKSKSFDKYINRSHKIYERNPRCFNYILDLIEPNNNIFNVFISSVKKYNICEDILDTIGKYFGKYQLDFKIINPKIVVNFELTKKIFRLNKNLNIKVPFPSAKNNVYPMPLLYYLVYEKYHPIRLKYFLSIGCNPNEEYKYLNNNYGVLEEYESLLEYTYQRSIESYHRDKFYYDHLISIIKNYGGKISKTKMEKLSLKKKIDKK